MIFPFILPASLALATPTEIVLLGDDGKVVRRVEASAKRLEWSPDGRNLAFVGGDGSLSLLGEGSPTRIAERGNEPAWSRDGRLFFTQGAEGVAVLLPGSAATLLVPTAHSPAPSPDGTRLAFATDGAQGGIWTAGSDGSGARRLLKGAATGGVSWSYDGRWIAAVVDRRLRIFRSNGLSLRDLGEVQGSEARWSGGSPSILAQRGGRWAVYDVLQDAWTESRLEKNPRWVGPNRLLGVQGGKAVEETLGSGVVAVSEETAIDAARVVGIYRGASFPDRFASAPRPTSGTRAWRGQILSSDPILGTLSFSVEAEIDARGRETEFGRAAIRRAKVPVGPLGRRLAVLPETDAWLVVSGNSVVDAFLPDAAPLPASVGRARAVRATRQRENDGVSMDRVIVPLVYPIPGRHRLVDTFLAPRANGARRHHGNDLMAPKMTPLLAVFDGTVWFGRTNVPGAQNSLSLRSDDGWTASYLHVNNDTPGTNDGRGSWRYAFPADLQPGDRVRAGQVVAWCGNSGNAEATDPHLHFELYDEDGGAIIDPFFSLKAGQRLAAPRYPDPDPDLRPVAGEVRWDGVALAVDRVKSIVAIELTGTRAPSKAPSRNLKPRVVYLVFPLGRALRYRGAADLAYPLDAVQPGMRISGAGSVQGAKMAVQRASMALASG